MLTYFYTLQTYVNYTVFSKNLHSTIKFLLKFALAYEQNI